MTTTVSVTTATTVTVNDNGIESDSDSDNDSDNDNNNNDSDNDMQRQWQRFCARLGKAQVMLIAHSMTSHMASHAYSWNIIGWRTWRMPSLPILDKLVSGHAILDEHDSRVAALKLSARLHVCM